MMFPIAFFPQQIQIIQIVIDRILPSLPDSGKSCLVFHPFLLMLHKIIYLFFQLPGTCFLLHRGTKKIIQIFFPRCRIRIIHALKDFIHIQIIPCNIINMKPILFMGFIITGYLPKLLFSVFLPFRQFPIMIFQPQDELFLLFSFIQKTFQHNQNDNSKNHPCKYYILHSSNSCPGPSISTICFACRCPSNVFLYAPIHSYFSHICIGKTLSALVFSKK